MVGGIGFNIVQRGADAAEMADLTELNQDIDRVKRKAFGRRGCQWRALDDLVVRRPFNVQQGMKFLQQLPQIDRLDHVVVVEALGFKRSSFLHGERLNPSASTTTT